MHFPDVENIVTHTPSENRGYELSAWNYQQQKRFWAEWVWCWLILIGCNRRKLTFVIGSFSFSVTQPWRFKLRALQMIMILLAAFSSNGLITESGSKRSFFWSFKVWKKILTVFLNKHPSQKIKEFLIITHTCVDQIHICLERILTYIYIWIQREQI